MTLEPTAPAVHLDDPVYTIEHIAALLHVAVDTAREHTYRSDFPLALDLGRRGLWLREELLAWLQKLPRRSLESRRRDSSGTAAQAPAPAAPVPAQRRHSSYRPRPKKTAGSAA